MLGGYCGSAYSRLLLLVQFHDKGADGGDYYGISTADLLLLLLLATCALPTHPLQLLLHLLLLLLLFPLLALSILLLLLLLRLLSFLLASSTLGFAVISHFLVPHYHPRHIDVAGNVQHLAKLVLTMEILTHLGERYVSGAAYLAFTWKLEQSRCYTLLVVLAASGPVVGCLYVTAALLLGLGEARCCSRSSDYTPQESGIHSFPFCGPCRTQDEPECPQIQACLLRLPNGKRVAQPFCRAWQSSFCLRLVTFSEVYPRRCSSYVQPCKVSSRLWKSAAASVLLHLMAFLLVRSNMVTLHGLDEIHRLEFWEAPLG